MKTLGERQKPGETDLGALERDLLEYRFSEDDDGEVDGSLLLMTPSSFMSPTKEALANLSPIDPISQARECRRRDPQRLLHESPRRRKIEESLRVSFLSAIPEEEWERYRSELESKTGATWNRVNFMERSWDVIRRYGTQSIMKVGLNQPIMRDVLEKIMNSIESDVLTESVTEDSADDQQVTKKLPVRRARKWLKRLIGKTGSRAVNQRVVKSKSQRSGGLFDERRSFRREQARRWCDADRGRKREPDTPYALGRTDHSSHEIKEDCTNPSRH